jgi:transposase
MANFSDNDFAFGRWETPFENARIELMEVEYGEDQSLAFGISVIESGETYRVRFDKVSAFRVLDESGLTEIWDRTGAEGGRRGSATFRVRNHLWTRESPLVFLASDGWSHIAASDDDCIEIVSTSEPEITRLA